MDGRGVTLVELVAAMSVAAALAGVAVFEFRDLQAEWHLSGAVRQVVLDLRMARIAAIAEARTHGLRFDTAAAAYTPESQDDDGAFTANGLPRRLPGAVRIVECTARGGAVRFRPLGNAASFGTITIEGPDTSSRRIVVDMAGRVRVAR